MLYIIIMLSAFKTQIFQPSTFHLFWYSDTLNLRITWVDRLALDVYEFLSTKYQICIELIKTCENARKPRDISNARVYDYRYSVS